MRDVQARSQLLPLLRSPFQGDLLAWLYLHPDQEYSLSDLARRFGVSQSTVSRETARLVEVDLIVERRYGNMRMVQANVESRLAEPLTRLLAATYGPSAVLGELLATAVAARKAAHRRNARTWRTRTHSSQPRSCRSVARTGSTAHRY
jgi:DNA-binding transcriptional ArsR family regulator